jgi:hypothetical protein
MTDNAGEMPTELEAVLPTPGIAEIETAPETAPPGSDEQVASPIVPEVDASIMQDAAEQRSLPFDVEHLGVLRRTVLDHLLDSADAGPQTVAQILAAMPAGTTRNSAESAVKREYDSGRIERVGPGTYRLASPRPPVPPEPTSPPRPEPVHGDGMTGEGLGALEADRLRKRLERQRDREAALVRQAAADQELRDKLLAATHGNYTAGPGLDDGAPIRAAMELVPLDGILSAIRYKTDKKLYPPNEPARSWMEPRLLRSIAERYCRFVLVPSLLKAWST